jgi:hypothetical protein
MKHISDKTLVKQVVHDEIPVMRKAGLRGLDEEGRNIVALATTVAPLAQKMADFATYRLGLVSKRYNKIANAYIARGHATRDTVNQAVHNDFKALGEWYDMLRNVQPLLIAIASKARHYQQEIPQTGVQSRHREFYDAVQPAYRLAAASLSDADRKAIHLDGGLDLVVVIGLLFVAMIVGLAIVVGGTYWATHSTKEVLTRTVGSTPVEVTRQQIEEIEQNKYLTPAEKREQINLTVEEGRNNARDWLNSSFFTTLGWIVAIGGGLWLVYMSGIFQTAGRAAGWAARSAVEHDPYADEQKRQAREMRGLDILSRKRDIGLWAPPGMALKVKKRRKTRKHKVSAKTSKVQKTP